MKDCKRFKNDFVAFLYGELGGDEAHLLKAHLDACPLCREEMEKLRGVIKGADSLKQEIDAAVASVDWEALPEQIVLNVFEKKAPAPRESWLGRLSGFLFQPKLRPVYAGLLLGILLGSLVTYLVFRRPLPEERKTGQFFAPPNFLERVELEMARRETLDYLDKSQYLLLDFIQSPAEKSTEFWRNEVTFQRTKDLLTKKRYINAQLDKFQMAKAKAICDQIELLFYELSQISVQLSVEELKKIQEVIEENQILLKINLLKKELQRNEV
jgi:hypothetical protein